MSTMAKHWGVVAHDTHYDIVAANGDVIARSTQIFTERHSAKRAGERFIKMVNEAPAKLWWTDYTRRSMPRLMSKVVRSVWQMGRGRVAMPVGVQPIPMERTSGTTVLPAEAPPGKSA